MIQTAPTTFSYNTAPLANQTVAPKQGWMSKLEIELAAPPAPQLKAKLRLRDWIFHPIQTWRLSNSLKVNLQPGETFQQRLAMYREISTQLSKSGQKFLYDQLKKGRLTDTQADDNKSTIAHLYAIVTRPRAQGLNSQVILEDTLRLMSQPQTITQKFAPLDPQTTKELMAYYRSPQGPKTSSPINVNMLEVSSSATCVASSVMYYMADHCPSEFARHIAELTSPLLAFQEKAWLNEIAPENPAYAAQKLNEYGIPATAVPGTNGAQYWIKVNLPYSGYLRAKGQQKSLAQQAAEAKIGISQPEARGVVESVYQAALTRLVVQSYDPGLDMRINPDGSLDPAKGLEEDRKTLMESIIKDNGGVMSVTYQMTLPTREGENYLMGYFRSFEQTTRDIMRTIDMGEKVIIGITDTDSYGNPGRINMGHEITLDKYRRDKRTGEIFFEVADSDDSNPNKVERSAREIIPKIHHAGFPVQVAQRIQNEMNLQQGQHMVPDSQDAGRFDLLAIVAPQNQQAFVDEYQKMVAEEEAKLAPAQATTQNAFQPTSSQYTMPQIQPTSLHPAQYAQVYYPYWGYYYTPGYVRAS